MKKFIRTQILIILLLSTSFATKAETKGFELGKWIEIHSDILKALNEYYVDSLPIERINKAGIDAMLSNIDPYTIYIPKEEEDDLQMMINKTYGGIGAIIFKPSKDSTVTINKPYKDTPAYKNHIICGDQILEIDGVNTRGLETKQCSDRMKGKPNTTVVFTVKKGRTGEIIKIPVVREKIQLPVIEYSGMLNDSIGYICQNSFTENVSKEIKKSYFELKKAGMKRLILDLRGNGGGLMREAINIVSLFVPLNSPVVSQKGNERRSRIDYKTTNAPIDTLIPLVVLVDGGSASASEIVSGAIQDLDRGVIMGEKTFGKGLVQNIVPLSFGGKMKVTTAKYYTPSGRCVQAIDYSKRNEDGSVAHIPDSLCKEFKTLKKGRIVKEGAGITPDIKLKDREFSRLTFSLVYSTVLDQYYIDFVNTHTSIGPIEKSLADYLKNPNKYFHLSDKEYEDFIKFALTKDFDFRSNAKAIFDRMKKELEKEGLAESMKKELDALNKAISIEKEQFLRLKKDEITSIIEQELATRYYYQEAGKQVNLRYDLQLQEALKSIK